MVNPFCGKKIIIFGAGAMARECIEALKAIDTGIYAVTDNNILRNGEEFMGYHIWNVPSIFSFVSQNPSLYTFIICSKSIDEISRQIEEQHFKGENIITFDEFCDILFSIRKSMGKICYNIDYHNQFKSWTQNLLSEVKFWYERAKNNKDFIKNLWGYNKNFFYQYLRKEVYGNDTVLDVGCGLVSYLGAKCDIDGGEINLIPVDPLANYYKAIIDKFSIDKNKEKMYVRFGMFEFLSYYFGENTADAIIISNALDHCIDPAKGVLEAVKTLKKETGELDLLHFINEGRQASYSGLHKWNLDMIDNDFVIWNNFNYINITDLLKDYAEVLVSIVDSKDSNGPRKAVLVNIRKLKDIEPEKMLDVKDVDRLIFSLQEMCMLQEDLNYCREYINLMES